MQSDPIISRNFNDIKVIVPGSTPYYEAVRKIVNDAIDESQIPPLDAIIELRAMCEEGLLLEKEARGMIHLILAERVEPDDYQVTKSKLVDLYTNPRNYAQLEGKVLTILAEEEKQIIGKMKTDDSSYRGYRKPKQQVENKR